MIVVRPISSRSRTSVSGRWAIVLVAQNQMMRRGWSVMPGI
jgi:hypothetical protein